jgi:chromosome segregation ATPase
MPTDPDQSDRIDIDLSDVDLTDELPILIETAVFESDKHLIALDADEDAEHTARVMALAPHEAEGVEALKNDLEQRAAKVQALEGDIARLSERWLEIERRLTEKDAAISSLTLALEAARSAHKELRDVEGALGAEIADRDSRIARLLDKNEQARKELAEARTAVERSRQEREMERREIATLRSELQRRVPAPAASNAADTALREQLDTLSTYVTNRRAWWDALESRAAQQTARISELEREVAERATRAATFEAQVARETTRAATFEAQAARETTRAEALSTQLAAEARKSEGLDSELKRLQSAPPAQPSLDRLASELERARAETAAAQKDRDQAREAVAALQRERDSEPRAESTSTPAELDAARRQLVDTRTELEQARADQTKLQRILAEKDRALAARDERLRALQAELRQRLGAQEKATATEVSGNVTKLSERSQRTETLAEPASTPVSASTPASTSAPTSTSAPALICLTSDGPRPFALAKGTITIGRSSDCDIQILTHFVSREHARLTVSPRGGVLIEDLGSTNGVFVNSVRIERQELRHGDLVTVGESQFRFLETMAH